jgi:hypothetical protein
MARYRDLTSSKTFWYKCPLIVLATRLRESSKEIGIFIDDRRPALRPAAGIRPPAASRPPLSLSLDTSGILTPEG